MVLFFIFKYQKNRKNSQFLKMITVTGIQVITTYTRVRTSHTFIG